MQKPNKIDVAQRNQLLIIQNEIQNEKFNAKKKTIN